MTDQQPENPAGRGPRRTPPPPGSTARPDQQASGAAQQHGPGPVDPTRLDGPPAATPAPAATAPRPIDPTRLDGPPPAAAGRISRRIDSSGTTDGPPTDGPGDRRRGG